MAQDDFIRTALRVPPALHAAIHEAAEANNRTFNAEILERLRRSFLLSSAEVEVAELKKQIGTQLAVQTMLGFLVKELAAEVPADSDLGKPLLTMAEKFGAAMQVRDYKSAIEASEAFLADGRRRGLKTPSPEYTSEEVSTTLESTLAHELPEAKERSRKLMKGTARSGRNRKANP